MSKDKKVAKAAKESKKASSPAREAAVDPILASLFASSSGPITAPVRNTTSIRETKQHERPTAQKDDSESEATSEDIPSDGVEDVPEPEVRPRKRRRLSKDDDIETTYLNQLVREEQKEMSKRQKKNNDQLAPAKVQNDEEDDDDSDTASSASNDLEDLSDLEDGADDKDAIPQHESLSSLNADYDKTRRTVFLGNVSTEAIKSKSSRKELEAHLKSALTTDSEEKIESLRFRSTAFDVSAGPKKAAYAKKELMDETTKCTNAYAVFNTEAAAKKVAKSLNGTLILGRHLHTDWLAHPTAIDHKRCVFVGNLNFVDIESNIDTNNTSTGEPEKRRPRAKEPADAEEGLWRAFEKCGQIESVRVIRDKTTRVGKGFAYVQFVDEVGTEKALALDGKKFPPMLPRLLRVSRAKRVLKKDVKRKREDEERTGSRGSKHSNSSSRNGSQSKMGMKQQRKKLDGVVFEGYRASADKGMKFKMKGKKKNGGGVKPSSRSSKRGSAFKASGGKKKRDMK